MIFGINCPCICVLFERFDRRLDLLIYLQALFLKNWHCFLLMNNDTKITRYFCQSVLMLQFCRFKLIKGLKPRHKLGLQQLQQTKFYSICQCFLFQTCLSTRSERRFDLHDRWRTEGAVEEVALHNPRTCGSVALQKQRRDPLHRKEGELKAPVLLM